MLPEADFDLTGGEAESLRALISASTNECMASRGYEYDFRPDPTGRRPLEARRYGLVDLTFAREHGYDVPVEQFTTGQGEYDDAFFARYGVEGSEALSACYAASYEAVGWSLEEQDAALRTIERVFRSTWDRSFEDSRVQAAFEAWSECMADRGYDYQDPFEVADDDALFPVEPLSGAESEQIARNGEEPNPTPEQIAVAVAEVECKEEHNVVGIWLAVETAYQEEEIDENAEVLAELAEEKERVLRAVAERTGG